jgi:hypothetical protein
MMESRVNSSWPFIQVIGAAFIKLKIVKFVLSTINGGKFIQNYKILLTGVGSSYYAVSKSDFLDQRACGTINIAKKYSPG